jgi:hypothetical protein
MKSAKTFTATIYVGFKMGYNGDELPWSVGEKICQDFVNDIGLCVTLTPTAFVYKYGRENGMTVGLINYPRFPDAQMNIKVKAFRLAKLLMSAYRQQRVSVVFPDETFTLSQEDENGKS